MIYASVCSGVEAASLAWIPLGWKTAWFSTKSARLENGYVTNSNADTAEARCNTTKNKKKMEGENEK